MCTQMSDPTPLPVWPWPLSPERLALLKEAKAQIDTDVRIYPAPAEAGSPGRILAFGEVAPVCAEQILIRPENTESIDSIRNALMCWIDPPAGFVPTVTEDAWLSAVMGCDVRLIYEEVPEAPARPETLRNY